MVEYTKNADGTINRIETIIIKTDNIVLTSKQTDIDVEIANLQAKIAELQAEKTATINAKSIK